MVKVILDTRDRVGSGWSRRSWKQGTGCQNVHCVHDCLDYPDPNLSWLIRMVKMILDNRDIVGSG